MKQLLHTHTEIPSKEQQRLNVFIIPPSFFQTYSQLEGYSGRSESEFGKWKEGRKVSIFPRCAVEFLSESLNLV